MIPDHFHDELQKSGENSSVCVVSGNKKYIFALIIQNVLYVILNRFRKIIRNKNSIFWPTTFLIHLLCAQTCAFVDKSFLKITSHNYLRAQL